MKQICETMIHLNIANEFLLLVFILLQQNQAWTNKQCIGKWRLAMTGQMSLI